MELTDEQVVRTLAEFEGYEIGQDEEHRWLCWKMPDGRVAKCKVKKKPNRFGFWTEYELLNAKWHAPLALGIPHYLTDYNAIAAVWRKLKSIWSAEEDTDASAKAWEINVNAQRLLSLWYDSTPRDHAYAIARAILESKK